MRILWKLTAIALSATAGFGQLTTDQKVSDFLNIVAVYDKNYGPYEWKRDALGFDLLDISPWVAKVGSTKNDLDFYEVLISYVASLNDAHVAYALPSNFVARLNFGVDLYDGNLLVDSITRARLPVAEFPVLIGYELVSIDGKDARQILDGLLQYNVAANPRSTRRLAAQFLTVRPQSVMPHAADIPDISVVVFRRPDGALESYRIPWTKSGLPLINIGKYITPSAAQELTRSTGEGDNNVEEPAPDALPDYMLPLAKLWNCLLPDRSVVGFGVQSPVFLNALPDGFTRRLGGAAADVFFSGTFEAGGVKLGFIRIPNFTPASTTTAVTNFQREIDFFEKNTDGLIVDVMRNPGGSVSYANSLIGLLIPTTWRGIAFEIRATSAWVSSISSAFEQAKAAGAPPSTLDLLQAIKDEIITANRANRGRTNPIPLDGVTIDRQPARDGQGAIIAYKKPLMVLIDELSASGGDAFAATIQDNRRGPLFGWRTMGAGGNVVNSGAGSYSNASVTVTQSLMNRKDPIVTGDYPTAPYVENIGVRPDLAADYMTRDNLIQNGRPFVDAFVAAMVDHVQRNK